jgi:hypothetical protein
MASKAQLMLLGVVCTAMALSLVSAKGSEEITHKVAVGERMQR